MSTNSIQFQILSEQSLINREVPSQRILELQIQSPKAGTITNRSPLNLAIIIDKSGSMSGSRLEFAKQAAIFVTERLEAKDRVALIAFDDQIEVLSPSILMVEENKKAIKQKISEIRFGGTTNLGDGWLTGCQQIAEVNDEDSIDRALLLTDGHANVGIVDIEELSTHARELAKRGISTSTFGVGHGFNEHLLEAMSNQGRGNFYFIEAPMGIPDIFLNEFKELSSITAADVEIELEIPNQVSYEILGGWAHEVKEKKLTIFVGNLFSEQSLEVYIKLLTPPSDIAAELHINGKIRAKDENGQVLETASTLKFIYSDQETVKSEPRKHDLLERFATVELADKTTAALKLERSGEREKASRIMNQTIMENMPYLSPEQATKYQDMSERMKRGMEERDRKTTQYDSYREKRRRGEY